MTELENLQSQLRESKMRLRELRTENAELKIQYRRWLWLSAGVSLFSLALTVITVIFSGDVVISPYGNLVEAPEQVVDKVPKALPLSPVVETTSSPDSALEAPAINISDVNHSSSELTAPELPSTFDIDSSTAMGDEEVENTVEPIKSNFSLPGQSGKPHKKVINYVIQKNDNLWSIVKRYYGTATPKRIQKVMKDNGLSDTNLRPGATLLLIIED